MSLYGSAEEARLRAKLDLSLGSVIDGLLGDPRVSDIAINPDGSVFVERVGLATEQLETRFTPAQTVSLIKTVATLANVLVNRTSPVLEAELPGTGARFEGILPPAASGPTACIRKRASKIYYLEEYVAQGRMSAQVSEALRTAVLEHQNILLVGGTGSGKTTLANALLAEVAQSSPLERVVLIEDTLELQCATRNLVSLRTVQGAVTMQDLLRATLRLRPDRIVVGEVRGAEALTLLKAWNTGHPGGISTVHANGAPAGLMRLEQMAAEGTRGFVPRPEVAEAVNVVVSICRGPRGPQVDRVLRVAGLDERGEYAVKELAR